MLDVFNIAKNDGTQIFLPNTTGATSSNEWQIWQKPKNCEFVYIFVLGGGAGGAGGVSGAPGTNRSGGGGGAGASASFGLFPAALLPDNLNILVGRGGAGGAASTNGSAGSISYVSFEASTNVTNILLASASSTAAAGTSSTGLGGTAGGVFAPANGYLSYLGVIDTMVGIAGAPANGSTTPGTMVCGGAGGGTATSANVNNAGGSINATTYSTSIAGGAAGGTNPGYDGICTGLPNSGLVKLSPTTFTGGSGGGANSAGTAGAGGNGSFGCGGAGGGAGTTGARGGNGGDGLVIISTW